MFKKTTLTLALASLLGVAAAQAAILSDPTQKVVGFKPVFENQNGAGSVSGELKPGEVLTVDVSKLQYKDADGDPIDPDATEFEWKLNGVTTPGGNPFTIPTDADVVGKKLTLTLIPVAKEGDPTRGKPLTLTDLRTAGATGGDGDGNIAINTAMVPKVSDIKMTGKLAQEQTLSATYTFNSQGGNTTDNSTFAWGFKGTTAANVVSAGQQVTQSGKVGDYTVQKTDAGQVLELSVRAINGASLVGNIATLDTSGQGDGTITGITDITIPGGEVPYIKADPARVQLSVTSTATEEDNGYVGDYPVANVDQVTAVITAAPGASPKVEDYTFQWKVGNTNVGASTAGNNTFMPQSAHQGQEVTVEVAPVSAPASR